MIPTRHRNFVLLVVNDPRYFVTHRLPLAQRLRAAGWRVEVAAPYENSAYETIAREGIATHRVRLERQGLNPAADALSVAALARLYNRTAPDVVHHVTIKPVLYGSVAAWLARVPAVVNAVAGLGTLFAEGGVAASARAALVRAAYRAALRHPNSWTIFQNAEDKAAFIAAGIARAGRTALIPGAGVVLDEFGYAPEAEGVPVVVLPARLLRQKGIAEFAEAARRLRAAGVSARFALVGDTAGNRDAVPDDQLRRWSDDGTLELWGWRDDMPEVMRSCAVVCLPTYYREGLPKALIDAAAGARPIVATDIPGCRDAVEQGVNGLLVPPRDVDALVAALRELLSDRELRSRMGQASRRIAEERFSIVQVAAATMRVYAQALDAARSDAGVVPHGGNPRPADHVG